MGSLIIKAIRENFKCPRGLPKHCAQGQKLVSFLRPAAAEKGSHQKEAPSHGRPSQKPQSHSRSAVSKDPGPVRNSSGAFDA